MLYLGLDWLEIWNLCTTYCDHFEWPQVGMQNADKKHKEKGGKGKKEKKDKKSKSSTTSKKSSTASKKSSKSGTKSSKSKKSKKGVKNFLDGDSFLRPFHLVAQCHDMR